MNDSRTFGVGDRVFPAADGAVFGTICALGGDDAAVVWDNGQRELIPIKALRHLRPMPNVDDPAALLEWLSVGGPLGS